MMQVTQLITQPRQGRSGRHRIALAAMLAWLVALAGLLVPATARGQGIDPFAGGPAPMAMSDSGGKVTLTTSANFTAVEPGQQVVVSLQLVVEEGWHAQSATPLEDHLIAFRI
ncbi:MAG: hypothetical protein AAGK78_07260, partial [Planctomycetota bacterium]